MSKMGLLNLLLDGCPNDINIESRLMVILWSKVPSLYCLNDKTLKIGLHMWGTY